MGSRVIPQAKRWCTRVNTAAHFGAQNDCRKWPYHPNDISPDRELDFVPSKGAKGFGEEEERVGGGHEKIPWVHVQRKTANLYPWQRPSVQ